MKKIEMTCSILLPLCVVVGAADNALANTLSVNIADYNAAQVNLASNIVTVPSGLATYSVTTAQLPIGTALVFTLPSGFTFGSTPSLTSTGSSTFALISGGNGSQSATFQVNTAPVATTQTVSLRTFTAQGVGALTTPIPIANALPLSVQALGIDPSPLTQPAFASEPGAQAVFVGAIQFIDLTPPTLGRLFGTNPATDSATAVLSATAISAQTLDAATQTRPVLSANGNPNSLNGFDTATITEIGYLPASGGISKVFASRTSDCTNPFSVGTVSGNSLTVPGVPINTEFFVCATADGKTLLTQSPHGFTSIIVAPGSSSDFLAGGPVNNEFPGLTTYFGGGDFASFTYESTNPAYPSYIRIVNNSSVAEPVIALVQGDGGSVGQTTVEAGLPANTNAVVPVSTIVANAGVTASSQRVSITLFAPQTNGASCVNNISSLCSVMFSTLQLSPDDTLTQTQ